MYLNDNEIYDCQYCKKQKHDAFNCPKIHYIPLKMHVIYKNINIKKLKNICL